MRLGKKKKWGGKLKKQKKVALALYSIGLVLSLLLLVLALSFLSKISGWQIKNIVVEGNFATPEEDILALVEEDISGAFFNLFSKRNALLYPTQKIRADLLFQFARIGRVDLSVKDFKTLHIEIIERKPDALWCGEIFNLSAGGCYFLDEGGFVYSAAPEFSGYVFFKNFGELPNSSSPIGQRFLPEAKYQILKFFRNTLLEYKLSPIALNKLSQGDMEIYLEKNGKIIYNSEQDIAEVSLDLGSILNAPSFKELFYEDEDGELQYIDLRFKNKAYFKFK